MGPVLRRWRVWSALLAVGLLWGSAFPLVRVTAPLLGPVGVTFARILLGALLLVLLVTAGGAVLRRRTWRAIGSRLPALLLLAALNATIPLTLVATAIVGLNASLAAVLNATTPMVTLAVAASLAAALCYALAGVYARTRFADVSPTTLALGQQLGAALLLLTLALAVPPPGPYTAAVAWALLVLGVELDGRGLPALLLGHPHCRTCRRLGRHPADPAPGLGHRRALAR